MVCPETANAPEAESCLETVADQASMGPDDVVDPGAAIGLVVGPEREASELSEDVRHLEDVGLPGAARPLVVAYPPDV